MNIKLFKLLIVIALLPMPLVGQNVTIKHNGNMNDPMLYAHTKQLGQFFNRFNNEEDKSGGRLYAGDANYREAKGRENYITYLFDGRNTKISKETKSAFVRDAVYGTKPTFLALADTSWFAEVNAKFKYKGKDVDILMYMKIERENLGLKWVIANVYFDEFNSMFFTTTPGEDTPKFIHPKSHELDFMNLRKVFANNKNVEFYAGQRYAPDHLTLFFYEIKQGNLIFQSVENLKYHLFQVEGWYFEVSEFNRNSYNSGWLISNAFKVDEAEKLRFFNQMLLNYY